MSNANDVLHGHSGRISRSKRLMIIVLVSVVAVCGVILLVRQQRDAQQRHDGLLLVGTSIFFQTSVSDRQAVCEVLREDAEGEARMADVLVDSRGVDVADAPAVVEGFMLGCESR